MTIATQGTARNYLQRAPSPSGLAEVIDLILDKGLVIDAMVTGPLFPRRRFQILFRNPAERVRVPGATYSFERG